MARKIKIFDTTLRDGEQCPGASLNFEEKMEIARQLARLNVDVVEAGFAIASPGDFEAINRIAKEVKGPIICSLARCKKDDIKAAGESVAPAEKKRIHTFIATSPIHMEKKLKMTPDKVLESAVAMVKYAKTFCQDVEFSCEDAGRSEPAFLYKIIEAVIAAGATVVNIPDTVGYTIPDEFSALVKGVMGNVPNINKVDVSVHCHNDLGLAVANSLEAVIAGVAQVECTINGIGERAGNASLEEVVMALRTRKDFFACYTDINTKEIYKASRMVSNLTGLVVQPNKAIVGSNAFAHEAGIHQHGVMSARETYEIMDPKDIGLSESQLVLGKHSGRNALAKRLKELGYEMDRTGIEKAYERFIRLADKKKEITDRDLESIMTEEISPPEVSYQFKKLSISSGTERKPSAEVILTYKKKDIKKKTSGDGPVDAVCKAIAQITKIKATLVDYVIQAITGGTDAQGDVTIRLSDGKNIYTGRGIDTDIIVASAKAYLAAVNRLLSKTAPKQKPTL